MIDERSKPAFQALSNTNKGPLVIVASYIFLISSSLAVVIKIWTRLSTARKLIWTDWAMLAAIVLAFGQTIALTISVNHGLGRHVDDLSATQLDAAAEALYASNILTIPTLAAAKTSVTLLIVSIQPLRPVRLASYAFLGVVGVWMVAGTIALAVQCDLPTPWRFGSPQTCVNQYGLQIGLGVFNILSDFVIVGLALAMMWNVQISFAKKFSVTALFGTRVATPPLAIAALVVYYPYFHSQPQDRTWHAVAPAIWTQIMLNISIITASIPSIKKFLVDVQSGLMGVTISEMYEMTHSGGKPTQVLSGSRSRLDSKSGSRLGIFSNKSNKSQGMSGANSSQGGREHPDSEVRDGRYGNAAYAKPGKPREQIRETESVKGLKNNAIYQTVDYDVEYEHRSTELVEERPWSDGRDRSG